MPIVFYLPPLETIIRSDANGEPVTDWSEHSTRRFLAAMPAATRDIMQAFAGARRDLEQTLHRQIDELAELLHAAVPAIVTAEHRAALEELIDGAAPGVDSHDQVGNPCRLSDCNIWSDDIEPMLDAAMPVPERDTLAIAPPLARYLEGPVCEAMTAEAEAQWQRSVAPPSEPGR